MDVPATPAPGAKMPPLLICVAPTVPEKSTIPLATKRALPPVALPVNWVLLPACVVMVALPAVLVSANERRKKPDSVTMFAFAAVLELAKVMEPALLIFALPALLWSLKKMNEKVLVIVALPAVLWFAKVIVLPNAEKVGVWRELLTTPLPLILSDRLFRSNE